MSPWGLGHMALASIIIIKRKPLRKLNMYTIYQESWFQRRYGFYASEDRCVGITLCASVSEGSNLSAFATFFCLCFDASQYYMAAKIRSSPELFIFIRIHRRTGQTQKPLFFLETHETGKNTMPTLIVVEVCIGRAGRRVKLIRCENCRSPSVLKSHKSIETAGGTGLRVWARPVLTKLNKYIV
jgi:hypothetical protein